MRLLSFGFLFFILLTKLTFSSELTLRVGISSMITPVDTVRYYDEIVSYIGKKLNKKIIMVHKKRYEEMNKLIEKKEVDLSFICTAAFIHLKDNNKVELVAAPVKYEKPFYRALIIVHRESNVKEFADLKGKSFVFVDPLSNTGYLYPLYRLSQMKRNPNDFFIKTSFSYSHNKSIELVAKKQFDGASVESLVFEYMKETNSPYISEVKIIEQSMDFASPPIVIRSDLPKELKREIKKIILNMHKDNEGKIILSNMRIKRFEEVKESDYDSVKNMIFFVENFSKGFSNKKIKRELAFVINDIKNPRILFEKYQPLVDYISKSINMPIQLLVKDHNELINMLRKDEIDMGFAGVLDFIKIKEIGKIKVVAIPKNKNKSKSYRVALVTQKGGIVKIEDIKGKRLGFGPLGSDELNFIPRLMLAQAGIHLSEIKGYKHYTYEDTIIKAILKNEVDVGVIRDVYKEKLEKLGFRIIALSDEVPYGPFFINSSLDKDIQNKIETLIMNIPDDVLKKLDYDLQGGFSKVDSKEYEVLENKYRKIPSSCGVKCHPGSKN